MGGETVERGGRATQAGSRPTELTGGTAGVMIDGGAGGEAGSTDTVVIGGSGGEPHVTAGQPGTYGGEPSLLGGAGGIRGEAGSPGGGAAGEPSTGGQPPVVDPWKVCQDGEICATDEVCVYDTGNTGTHRACWQQDDDLTHQCIQDDAAPTQIIERCAAMPPICQHTWRACSRMSIDAAGTDCGLFTHYPFTGGERWSCGPPP